MLAVMVVLVTEAGDGRMVAPGVERGGGNGGPMQSNAI